MHLAVIQGACSGGALRRTRVESQSCNGHEILLQHFKLVISPAQTCIFKSALPATYQGQPIYKHSHVLAMNNHPESSLLHHIYLFAPHPTLIMLLDSGDCGFPALTVGLPKDSCPPCTPVCFQPLQVRGPGTLDICNLPSNKTHMILEKQMPFTKWHGYSPSHTPSGSGGPSTLHSKAYVLRSLVT